MVNDIPQMKRGLNNPYLPSLIYEGIITNHLDLTKQGMIEVSIKFAVPGDPNIKEQTVPVRYVSPFAGNTSVDFEGNDSTKYDDVQKSYGMWMVPPDIGTRVLVAFANSDFNQGYVIGYLFDEQQNFMVPGLAATKNTAATSDQLAKYKQSYLPVAESLKGTRKGNTGPSVDKILRPIHPFADRLLEQGLLADEVRGTTTSSARREIPSYVFGISTPGPLDKNGPKKPLKANKASVAPVSRLGGSTFVMDDGDADGNNELVRIRTRTGHQILLHNTKDLIYIGNARGTAWIELTGNGKIDIYAADSVSIHTEQDLNLRADRNINIEAGGNVNISSNMGLQIESGAEFNLLAKYDMNVKANNAFSLDAQAGINVKSNYDLNLEASGNFNIKGDQVLKIGSTGKLHLKSEDDLLEEAKNIHIKSIQDTFITTGGQLHLNGAPASPAESPSDANTRNVAQLPRFALPNRSVLGTWENNFYKVSDLYTIMTRVPTHEPYDQHESVNPEQFSFSNLDQSTGATAVSASVASTISKTFKAPPNVVGTPPPPTGNTEQDNLQAFLWMIRVAEGTAYPKGYQAQWPSREFDINNPTKSNGQPNLAFMFKDHPREVATANGIPSSAAGAYQFLASTWDDCKRTLDLKDFSPANQDKAAVFLLALNDSVELIKKGQFSEALYRNRKTWASLPGANYPGQGMKPYARLVQAYKSAGGKLA